MAGPIEQLAAQLSPAYNKSFFDRVQEAKLAQQQEEESALNMRNAEQLMRSRELDMQRTKQIMEDADIARQRALMENEEYVASAPLRAQERQDRVAAAETAKRAALIAYIEDISRTNPEAAFKLMKDNALVPADAELTEIDINGVKHNAFTAKGMDQPVPLGEKSASKQQAAADRKAELAALYERELLKFHTKKLTSGNKQPKPPTIPKTSEDQKIEALRQLDTLPVVKGSGYRGSGYLMDEKPVALIGKDAAYTLSSNLADHAQMAAYLAQKAGKRVTYSEALADITKAVMDPSNGVFVKTKGSTMEGVVDTPYAIDMAQFIQVVKPKVSAYAGDTTEEQQDTNGSRRSTGGQDSETTYDAATEAAIAKLQAKSPKFKAMSKEQIYQLLKK